MKNEAEIREQLTVPALGELITEFMENERVEDDNWTCLELAQFLLRHCEIYPKARVEATPVEKRSHDPREDGS